ncbi:hypothetical protein EKQ44_16685 [Sutcliffiella horikoshii]|nr:hypothetical protein [Sutcliffiella horikoshii]
MFGHCKFRFGQRSRNYGQLMKIFGKVSRIFGQNPKIFGHLDQTFQSNTYHINYIQHTTENWLLKNYNNLPLLTLYSQFWSKIRVTISV